MVFIGKFGEQNYPEEFPPPSLGERPSAMRARPDEVRPGFRARHGHASRPDRKGGGNFYSGKLPSRGHGKPQCGLSVTMPPEGCPLCRRETSTEVSRLNRRGGGGMGLAGPRKTAMRFMRGEAYVSAEPGRERGHWPIARPTNPYPLHPDCTSRAASAHRFPLSYQKGLIIPVPEPDLYQ